MNQVDSVAEDIVRQYQPQLLSVKCPLTIIGDGNCMYRAISCALTGTENFYILLRLLVAIELISHREFYDVSDFFNDFHVLTGNFSQIVHDAVVIARPETITVPAIDLIDSSFQSDVSASDNKAIDNFSKDLCGTLANNKFMDIEILVNNLTNARDCPDNIPQGPKENVFFLVNNSENIKRKDNNKRSAFSDDFGFWESNKGTSPKSHYLRNADGTLTMLYKRDGVFCTRKKSKGSVLFCVMSPQPTDLHSFSE